MGDEYPKIKVAAVQAAPVFLNREATVEKACGFIREAGANGARIVGFPESFIPGHPLWYHFHPATSPTSAKLAAELFKNAVEIPGPATDALCAAARDAGVYVVMGLCEKRAGTFGTMYNSQLFIDRFGRILGKHQKLVPTNGERIVHTGGYGDTLRAFPTEYGKIGGLMCGENSNPLAVFALMAEGEMIHVASWPSHGRKSAALRQTERNEVTGRSVAFMTKAYVINAGGIVSPEMVEILASDDSDREFLTNPRACGGSSIVDPRGTVIAGPMGNEEGILYADVDLNLCVREKVTHDFSGHYNRADVLTLRVNTSAPTLYERVAGSAPHQTDSAAGEWEEALSQDGPTAEIAWQNGISFEAPPEQ